MTVASCGWDGKERAVRFSIRFQTSYQAQATRWEDGGGEGGRSQPPALSYWRPQRQSEDLQPGTLMLIMLSSTRSTTCLCLPALGLLLSTLAAVAAASVGGA